MSSLGRSGAADQPALQHIRETTSADDISIRIAKFIAETPYAALPANALHAARRCILDNLGCGLGGNDHPSGAILLQYAHALGGAPQAQVWGRADRLPVEFAALVNGQQAHVFDFDDTFMPPETILHASSPLVPALLAVAEARHLSGKAVLRATVLGFDLMARLAHTLGRAHYNAGWHVTATAGPVGCAAGVAALIGLDAPKLLHAIGIGITHSGGVGAMSASMCKAYHAGRGAELGARAALLAELGFDSAAEPLTATRGYLNVIQGDRVHARMTDRLGERFFILENGFKPYASGVLTHPLIDIMVDLGREGFEADQIARVDVRMNPYALTITGRAEPKTGLEGKFSLAHCGAVGFLDGTASKPQFTDTRVNDKRVVAFRAKLSLEADDNIAKDECRMTVTLAGGATIERHVPHATGTSANPMTDEGLATKFSSLAGPVLGERAAQVIDTVWKLDRLDDIAALTRLLAA